MTKDVSPPKGLINAHTVCQLANMSRSTVYLMIKEGLFPKPLQIGKKRVAWREAEVLEWIACRKVAEWAA
jgi:prophage regulatory protein